MKKLLSVILAASMLVSLFCVVPASAANAVWPYFFEDFEDNKSSVNGVTLTEGGVDGSVYSATIVSKPWMNSNVQMYSSNFSLDYVYGWVHTGDTITISYDIKLAQALESGVSTLYMHYKGANNDSAYNSENFAVNGYVSTPNDEYPKPSFDNTSTEWQKATFSFVYKGLDVFIDGSAGVNVRIPFDAENQSALIDNVEFKVVRPETGGDLRKTLFRSNFKDGTDCGITTSGAQTSVTVTEAPAEDQIATIDAKKSGYFLRVRDDNTKGHVRVIVPLSKRAEVGKYYRVKVIHRVVEAIDNSSGSPVSYNNSRGCQFRWIVDYNDEKNFTRSDIYAPVQKEGEAYNAGWVTSEFYYTPADETEAAEKFMIQIWTNYQSTGSDTGVYDIAYIDFTEVGPVIPGDFELEQTNKNKLYIVTGSLNGFGLTTTNVGIWNAETGTSVSYKQNGSAARTEGMYGGIFYWTQKDTKISTTVSGLLPDTTYTLYLTTKSGSSNAQYPLTIGMDYSASVADNTDADAVLGKILQPNSQNPKRYEIEFTTPAADELAEGNTLVTADLYFTMLSEDANNAEFAELINDGLAAGTRANLCNYIDNIGVMLPKLQPVVSATATVAEDASAVTFAKTFTAPVDVTDASVIKLTATKDGVKTYIGSTKDTTIAIPEAYRRDYAIAAEITPVGSNGYIGNVVTLDIEMPVLPEPEPVIELIADDGQVIIFTDTYIENARLIFASYDANGKMVDVEVRDNMSISVDAPEAYSPAELESGATTVAMLWTDFSATYKPMTVSVSW